FPSGSHLRGSSDLGRRRRIRNRISSCHGTGTNPVTPFHLEAHEPLHTQRRAPFVYLCLPCELPAPPTTIPALVQHGLYFNRTLNRTRLGKVEARSLYPPLSP